MDCKCNWVEAVLAVVIIIFAYRSSGGPLWIVVVAGVLLLLHALLCKMCGRCEHVDGKAMVKRKRK